MNKALLASPMGGGSNIPLKNTVHATMTAATRYGDIGYEYSLRDGRVLMGGCTDSRIISLYDIQQSNYEDAAMTFCFYPYSYSKKGTAYAFELNLSVNDNLIFERAGMVSTFYYAGGSIYNDVFTLLDLDVPKFAYKLLMPADTYTAIVTECTPCEWPVVYPNEWNDWMLNGSGNEARMIAYTKEYFEGSLEYDIFYDSPIVPGAMKLPKFGFESGKSYNVVVNHSDILWQFTG